MKRRSGFTMLEVLVASSLLATVIAMAAFAIDSAMRTTSHATVIADLRTRARTVIERMEREMTQSSPRHIYSAASGFANPLMPGETASGAIRFQLCTGFATATDVANDPSDPKTIAEGDALYEASHTGSSNVKRGYTVDTNAKTLSFQPPFGPSWVVLDHVESFTVSLDSSGRIVTVSITVQARDPAGKAANGRTDLPPIVISETATFVPRNP